MSSTSSIDRVRKSVGNLIQAGGRVVTVRLSPVSNRHIDKMMTEKIGKNTTQCVNYALENFDNLTKQKYLDN